MVFVTDGLLEKLLDNAIYLPPYSLKNVFNVSLRWTCPLQEETKYTHINNSACATIPLIKIGSFYIYTDANTSMTFSNIHNYTQCIKCSNNSVLVRSMVGCKCTCSGKMCIRMNKIPLVESNSSLN